MRRTCSKIYMKQIKCVYIKELLLYCAIKDGTSHIYVYGTREIRGRHDRKRRKYSTMTVQSNFSIVESDFISRHYREAMVSTGS